MESALQGDVCVPISRLTECLLGARQDIDESGLQAPIVGHVGDGNFHAMLLYNETEPDQVFFLPPLQWFGLCAPSMVQLRCRAECPPRPSHFTSEKLL